MSLLGCHNINGAKVCVPDTMEGMNKWADRIGNDPTCKNEGEMRCMGDGVVFATCIGGSWSIRRVCGGGSTCVQKGIERVSCDNS
jgi:hypothetical protein